MIAVRHENGGSSDRRWIRFAFLSRSGLWGVLALMGGLGGSSWALAQAPAAGQIELSATAPSWIRVRTASGKILVERTLPAGGRVNFPFQSGLRLDTGNAPALTLQINGRAANLKRPGQSIVMRDLVIESLSPASLPEAARAAPPRESLFEREARLARELQSGSFPFPAQTSPSPPLAPRKAPPAMAPPLSSRFQRGP